jgi:hypothetical protein
VVADIIRTSEELYKLNYKWKELSVE